MRNYQQPRRQPATLGSNSDTIVNRFIKLITAVVAVVAFAAPARAFVGPPGSQVQVSWPSLGSGASYTVQSSSDLSTWATLTNTAATNVTLGVTASNVGVFRLLASNVPLQSTALAWDPSAPATGVAGYYLYYGGASGVYTNKLDVGLTTSTAMNNLRAGAKYYFVMTAYSSSGAESAYSNEAVWQCPLQLTIQKLP